MFAKNFVIGIHHKNVVVHFLSAQNFAMDFPIHFQREIHRKKNQGPFAKCPPSSAKNFVMDLPMLSQEKIHRAIPQVHHKCPQKCGFVFSFSKEFCDGFSNTFPRKIHHIFLNPFTKCLPSSAKNFLLRIFRCITKVKTHRILFGSQSQKRLPGIWCWDPSQECVFVISVGKDFCDGFSCSFPRKINQKKGIHS